MQRRGGGWALLNFALVEAPPPDKHRNPETLAEHFKAIVAALGNPKAKALVTAIGVEEAVLKQIELPMMASEDVRHMLKLNSKTYLQLDLPDHLFDCAYLPPRQATPAAPADGAKPASAGQQKFKVLVTGAPRKTVEAIQSAAKAAGLTAESIIPSMIGPSNAFEFVEPDSFHKEVVGLVDIGFKHSSIVILDAGEMLLNRVVHIGSEKITGSLAEAMGITLSEAEGIKVGMPSEVQPTLEAVIAPLGRELRASFDFFEHQQDKTIAQVFVSGGAARNEIIVQALQNMLMVPCRSWNPTKFVQMAVPADKQGEVEQFAPQLSVALGSAAASF
ncbi:MAG: pilus assembly protein PilM [Verrucomicrobia bacterium]|nr:pilus assembly protein PilM [Verrucomicrobiota bacterium]MBI3870785.1 pilus assembly protein PilM [Verrucomicrobiota bacterium]